MGKVKLQLLTTTDDTKDNVVTYTSGDTANPTAFKDVAVLASNENHKSILNKISTMFNNVRYLYKILGNTDISALGSVTQAIATLNGNVGSMKGISSSAAITTQGQYALDAREKNASVDGTLANEIIKLNSNLGTWEDITDNCNLGYHQTTAGKIYKNSVLRLVSVKLWFSENINNQEYLCTVGTLPGGVIPEVLTFSANTQDTSNNDNPSIVLIYDSTGLRSSHSMDIPAISPAYTALLKY